MEYLVYKHTSPSGKSYIGITNDYNRRCAEHQSNPNCRAFYAAIQKYGWDNFTHELLYVGVTQDEANALEQQLICEHNTRAPNGYNLLAGGGVGGMLDETKQLISQALTGRQLTQEHRANLSAAKRGQPATNLGVPHTADTKAKIGNTVRARAAENRELRAAAQRGKKLSVETIAKRTATQKANREKRKLDAAN